MEAFRKSSLRARWLLIQLAASDSRTKLELNEPPLSMCVKAVHAYKNPLPTPSDGGVTDSRQQLSTGSTTSHTRISNVPSTMPLHLRKATLADEGAVSRICLLTGDAGKSAEHLFKKPEMPGLVYAVPYLHLDSAWRYVLVETDDAGVEKDVVGYVVGSSNCRAFEADAEKNWWPPLRPRYPKPEDADRDAYTGAELYYLDFIANPALTGQEVLDVYPAFLHINILPPHQGKGWGTKMIRQAALQVQADGEKGLWVGIDSRNDNGRQFYKAIGFEKMESKEGEYYGLDIKRFLDSGRGA